MSTPRTMPSTGRWAALPACALCAALAACGLQAPPVDVAQAPEGAFGSNGDNDVAAVNLASWGFSASSNLRHRPVEAARAVAAVDYLAGQFNNSGRWYSISPIVQMDMVRARQEVRAAVGIAPSAPSQVVVNSLSRYAATVAETGDPVAAGQFLANPAFTLGPQATEARLADLPFLSATNVATQRAVGAIGNGTGARNGGARP